MDHINKEKSPFYPGQPVPIDFFIGRQNEIERILRAVKQVEYGKPQAIFLTGEYGIGKSSLAGFVRNYARIHNNILGIHVFLGGAKTNDDVATKTVEAVIKSQLYESSLTEKIGNFLSKYIGNQELFGININLEVLKTDGPSLAHGYLPFLNSLFKKVKDDGIKGIMLILDELNGITGNDQFAHFIKAIVDENALSPKPLPLLLMLCGVEERRRDMIRNHKPIERIFDIVELKTMSQSEMETFFTRAFGSVDVKVDKDALNDLCNYSAGFPKIMHIIGDSVFWTNKDNVIDIEDSITGIRLATEELGRKFIDQQVYNALRSKDYHSILKKLGIANFDLSFKKTDIEKGLSEVERKKFDNFLQRMKKLNVLKTGDERGEYVFINHIDRYYIMSKSIREK